MEQIHSGATGFRFVPPPERVRRSCLQRLSGVGTSAGGEEGMIQVFRVHLAGGVGAGVVAVGSFGVAAESALEARMA